MTKEEIVEMARQVGAEFAELPMMDAIVFAVDDRNWNSKELECFAKLVAEKEREACAKLCESYFERVMASRIRARGEA